MSMCYDYKGIEDKMNRGEIERKIAQGLAYIDPKTGKPWYDEPERSILGCLFRQFVRRSACAILVVVAMFKQNSL